MSKLLREKFEAGLEREKFEAILGEYLDLHHHHYERANIEPFRQRVAENVPVLNIIVLTETWCGDSLAVVPPLLKLFADDERVQIRFVLRDQNLDLMDNYLSRGGKAIPKVIVMDAEFNELFNWGPRPQVAQQIFEDHRQMIADGKIEKAEVHKMIRVFYAKDHGAAVLGEFLDLLDRSRA